MFLWKCYYKDCEWCCFVTAPSRNRAKSIFHDYWSFEVLADYIDVRCCKIKNADGYKESLYDDDCKELKSLGVSFDKDIYEEE